MQELDKHRTRCSPPALTIRAFPNTVGCSRAAIGILPAVYLLLLGERTDAKAGAMPCENGEDCLLGRKPSQSRAISGKPRERALPISILSRRRVQHPTPPLLVRR